MRIEDALAWIGDDAAEMTAMLREAEPDQPVPACPGWSASDLGRHVAGGFVAWYCYNISTPVDEWHPDTLMARFGALGDEHASNVAAFESGVREFLGLCSELDLERPTWAFGQPLPAGWWIRRAATELTVHLTDAAGMHGRSSSTSAVRHSEAIDEVTTELMPRIGAVKAVMNAFTAGEAVAPATPDRPAALVAEDTGRAWTLIRHTDGSSRSIAGLEGDLAAVGRGSSADVLAWLHGRPMLAPLSVEGDSELLDDWNLFQRAGF